MAVFFSRQPSKLSMVCRKVSRSALRRQFSRGERRFAGPPPSAAQMQAEVRARHFRLPLWVSTIQRGCGLSSKHSAPASFHQRSTATASARSISSRRPVFNDLVLPLSSERFRAHNKLTRPFSVLQKKDCRFRCAFSSFLRLAQTAISPFSAVSRPRGDKAGHGPTFAATERN